MIEINRRRNRVILSERAALQEWRSQQKDRLLAELKEGEVRKGRVSSVRSFGVFIDLGGADGLAHLSEVSWDRNKTPEEMYRVGDEVDVYVMKVDPETKKIALSLRRAQPEEWDLIVDKYQVGRVVPGMVTKLVTFGAFARIEGPVEGLIHVSELVDRRIAHPKEVVREGDLLPLKIVRIERDRHRLGLSLREARDEGEQMGFTFSDAGEVHRGAGGHRERVRGARGHRRSSSAARDELRSARRRRAPSGGRTSARRAARRRHAPAPRAGAARRRAASRRRRWRRRSRAAGGAAQRAAASRRRAAPQPRPMPREPADRAGRGGSDRRRRGRRRSDAADERRAKTRRAYDRASADAAVVARPASHGRRPDVEDQGECRSSR